MARRTEYVMVFGCLCEQGNDVDGGRNKRQADKEIREELVKILQLVQNGENTWDDDYMLIAVRKYTMHPTYGLCDDDYWISPALALRRCPTCHAPYDASEPEALGYQ